MGLAEKRLLGEIKDTSAALQTDLNSAGFNIPFELDLSSFPEDEGVLKGYLSYRGSHGPGLVIKGLQAIGQDSFGKDAINEKIKKVVYQNSAKSNAEGGQKSVQLDGNTLLVRVAFGDNKQLFSESDMKAAIEGLL